MSPEQLTLFADQRRAGAHGTVGPLVRPPETREELDAIINAIPEAEIIACKWERVANGYMGPFCIINDCVEMMFWTHPKFRLNNSLTVAPDAQREAHTSGGIGSP